MLHRPGYAILFRVACMPGFRCLAALRRNRNPRAAIAVACELHDSLG